MLRCYRHRPSGAILTTSMTMQVAEWELLGGDAAAKPDGEQPATEKPAAKPRRPAVKKQASPRG